MLAIETPNAFFAVIPNRLRLSRSRFVLLASSAPSATRTCARRSRGGSVDRERDIAHLVGRTSGCEVGEIDLPRSAARGSPMRSNPRGHAVVGGQDLRKLDLRLPQPDIRLVVRRLRTHRAIG